MKSWVKYEISKIIGAVLNSESTYRVISEWAVTRDDHASVADNVWQFSNEENFTFEAPMSFDSLPEELQVNLGQVHIGRPFVSEFRDVSLIGPEALAMTNYGPILENAIGSPERLIISAIKTVASGTVPSRPKSPSSTLSVAVSLVGPWMDGYYHWFSDYLLRLEGIEYYQTRTGREPIVLIPPNPPRWMRESLKHAGVRKSRWREWDGGPLHVDRLIVPSLRRETHLTDETKGNVFSPAAYRWLRDRIRTSVGATDRDSSRQIFISREQADSRRVINRDEVMTSLDEHGFEKHVLERLPFPDQVELFADADTIIAPNGAGLVNMMYATNATVVILFGRYVNVCYPMMAASLGFDTTFLRCKEQGLDMEVSVNKLLRLLDKL